MASSVPHKTSSEIAQYAEDVLAEHEAEGAIPVQIEEIIEFGFGMEIRPMQALKSRYGFEGALSNNLNTILVDEANMLNYPTRYRFTLAHELGHRIMHEAFIKSLGITDKTTWKEAVAAINPTLYSRAEGQAYVFAGYLLVPTGALRSSFEEARQLALSRGIDFAGLSTSAIGYVAGSFARQFNVSTEVVERQLRAIRLP